MGHDGKQLLQDYNYWRGQTKHLVELRKSKPIRDLGEKKNLKVFVDLAQWCAEKEIEPRLWLYSLFQARRFLFAPPLKQLKSLKNLEQYTNLAETERYADRVRRESEVDQYDPNRDLCASVEAVKSYYLQLQEPDRCMGDMGTTLGFHPSSLVCARCVLRDQCAQHLQSTVPFDIVALRRGDLTAREAREVVYRARTSDYTHTS